jgi:acyl-CoA dehydrogenase
MVTLSYSEEHALLRSQARRWLAERCPMTAIRRFADDARGQDSAWWKELAELGWVGLVIPAEYGGSGLSFTHLAVLLEEAGRSLLPAPLLSTTLGAMAIAFGGSDAQRARWLPRLAAGDFVATLAHVEPDGAWRAADTTARRQRGRVSGEKHHVWHAPSADLFLVPVRDGTARAARLRLAVIERAADGIAVTPEVGLDPTRRSGRVRFDDVSVRDDALLPVDAQDLFAYLVPRACTALAAEMAGGADALLAMTATYATQRVQFARPIGSFQAIKHPLVNVLIDVEHVRSLVYAAAAALDTGAAEAESLARMAKAKASDAYVFAASRAVQFHGGFGFTYECDAHFFMRRALAARPAFGDAAHHRRWIAERAIAGAG